MEPSWDISQWAAGVERKAAETHPAESHIKISLYGKTVPGKPMGKTATHRHRWAIFPQPRRARVPGAPARLRLRLRHERGRVGHPPGRSYDRPAGKFRRRRLLHRPPSHAVDDARRVPEERARIRRGLHDRGRPTLRTRARRR